MNNSDEELQGRIENGHRADDSRDAMAYQKVFETLMKEPYHLPAHFAENIINRVEARGSSLSKDYFWLGWGLLSFVVAAIIAVLLTGFKLDFGTLKFFSSYSGLLLFGMAFILLLHWLDKKIIWKNISVT